MRYLIFAFTEDDEPTPMSAALPTNDARYLKRALDHLEPMTPRDYQRGPHQMLHTAARSSYVLFEQSVLWLTEWKPGMIVVRFELEGAISSTALRSPVPNFAGRKCTEEQLDAHDEDAPNPQYNLIFNAWDAQFDEVDREGFEAADEAEVALFEKCIANVSEMNDVRDGFQERIGALAGEGVIL